MVIKRSLLNAALRALILKSARSKALYRVARRYADDFSGEFNPDMNTNGEVRILRAACGEGGEPTVVLDVGANTGEWSAALLNICPTVTIHAFEPCAGSFRKLQERRFPAARVKVNQMAMGSSKAVGKMHVYGAESELNSLLARGDRDSTAAPMQEVAITTIDDYCREEGIGKIRFLKIDVEGFESKVLEGSREKMESGQIDFVQFEYGEGWIDARVFLKDAIEYLRPLPYDLFKLTPHNAVRVTRYRADLENFRNSNYLLVRRGADPNFSALGTIRED